MVKLGKESSNSSCQIKLLTLLCTIIFYFVLFTWALLNLAKYVPWSNDHISPRTCACNCRLDVWTRILITSIPDSAIVTYMYRHSPLTPYPRLFGQVSTPYHCLYIYISVCVYGQVQERS